MIEPVPLIAHAAADGIVAYRGAAPVTVMRFLADVRRNATGLRVGGYVLNLCADRYRFAVALGAALSRGVVTLLPPNAAPRPLRTLSAHYGDAPAIVDPGARFDGLRALDLVTGDDDDFGPVPAFAPDQPVAVVFTSGSTGEPQPHPKQWGSLVQGAAAAAAGLGIPAHTASVVGTVPPQHMYGLEATVMLALCNGLAFNAERPLYPADVRHALGQVPAPRVLATTPVHLRALLADGIELPELALVVCATAALPRALAVEAERRYRAPLREVYGFTEAGMVATRRTATQTHWCTVPGVSVRCAGAAATFHGGHVQHEVAPADILEVQSAGRFALRGRAADLVNVAGKRTSLAYLDHVLGSIEGVEDGAFLVPEEGDDARVTRLTAFAVAPSLGRDALLAALRERIDPVFLPRPMHRVQALPRNASGKLPRDALLALARRCADSARSRVLVPLDHALAQDHFPGNPIVPGAVVLDEVVRRAEDREALPAGAWEVRMAKFTAPLRPGEPMRVDFLAGGDGELRFDCISGTRRVATGVLRAVPARTAR